MMLALGNLEKDCEMSLRIEFYGCNKPGKSNLLIRNPHGLKDPLITSQISQELFILENRSKNVSQCLRGKKGVICEVMRVS